MRKTIIVFWARGAWEAICERAPGAWDADETERYVRHVQRAYGNPRSQIVVVSR